MGYFFIRSSTSTYTKLSDFNGDNGSEPSTHFYRGIKTYFAVELISFSGLNDGSKNILNWKTTSEINSNRYEVERSLDGHDFKKIGEVRSKTASMVIPTVIVITWIILRQRIFITG
jgi:hypothetical protein